MSDNITPLPLPFVTNVIVDARAVDVNIRVDPAMIFSKPFALGEKIPDDQLVGVALNIQKGSAVSILTLMENEKASELVEALITCIIRGDPEKLKRLEDILERVERAITSGFATPAVVPKNMEFKGVVAEENEEDEK